jgi:rhodanese-related sulfurtransferase
MGTVAKVGLLAVLWGLAPHLFAAVPEPPKQLKGVTVIGAERAQALMQQGALLVDARVALEYVEEHITGAVSIPYKEQSAKSVDFDASQDRFDVAKLPSDKSAKIIFYCNSGQCWKSYKASVVARRHGYTNVYWLRGGIPDWKSKNLPVTE